MTFEQWFVVWLASYLNEEVDTVLTPNKIAAIQSGYENSSSKSNGRFATTSLTLDCIFDKKVDAAAWNATLEQAIRVLPNEKFIVRASIGESTATRKGILQKWQYTSVVNIFHRVRESW